MPYERRTAPEIHREIIARMVARSTLDDVAEGSKLNTITQSMSEEFAAQDQRLKTIVDSFSFKNVQGSDLDDRAADLPPNGLTREQATNASGGALDLRRTDTSAPLTIPEGSLYGRDDDPSVIYRQVSDQTFNVGVGLIQGVAVVCLTAGEVGNCAAGQITRIVSAPADLGSAVSTIAISNGQEEETDAQFKARCLAYLSSLTKSTPSALEFLALSFRSAAGVRPRFARIFEDVEQPGYSELLLDDGGGLQGYDRPGATAGGVVPEGGPRRLWHEAPALETPTNIQITRGTSTFSLRPEDYIAIPERGLIHVKDGILQPGDVWSAEKYRVYEGLPAELQRAIEGDTSNPVELPGWRAAGTRVRVVQPTVYLVEMKVNVVPKAGFDFESIAEQTLNAIVEYLATLGPGEILFNARLIARLMENEGLSTVRLYVGAVDGLVPLPDYEPPTPRTVIRTTVDKLELTTIPEVF